jgi:hypothetical protein
MSDYRNRECGLTDEFERRDSVIIGNDPDDADPMESCRGSPMVWHREAYRRYRYGAFPFHLTYMTKGAKIASKIDL